MATDPEAAHKAAPFTEVEEPDIDEETRRHLEETQLAELKERWSKDLVSRHLISTRGVEICYFEFKEILLELATRLREKVDPTTGKLGVVLEKFIDQWVLPRLLSFVKFKIPTVQAKTDAVRTWPESEKDTDIKALKVQQKKLAEEEARRKEERDRQAAELARMAEEDTPALDFKEVEELRRKLQEKEEAERRAREALEEGASSHANDSSEDEEYDDENDDDSNAY